MESITFALRRPPLGHGAQNEAMVTTSSACNANLIETHSSSSYLYQVNTSPAGVSTV